MLPFFYIIASFMNLIKNNPGFIIGLIGFLIVLLLPSAEGLNPEAQKNGSNSYGYQRFYHEFSANTSAIIYCNGSSDYVEFATYHGNTAHNTNDSTLTNMRMFYLSN